MIKTLWKSLREYKKDTILTPILVIGEVLMEVLIPYYIAMLVNEIRANCSMDIIFKYGIKLLLLSIVSLIFGYLSGITSARASTGFSKNLRADIFKSIQKFSFANMDKYKKASLVTRLTVDIQDIQWAWPSLEPDGAIAFDSVTKYKLLSLTNMISPMA